jgi:hypothetical protein
MFRDQRWEIFADDEIRIPSDGVSYSDNHRVHIFARLTWLCAIPPGHTEDSPLEAPCFDLAVLHPGVPIGHHSVITKSPSYDSRNYSSGETMAADRIEGLGLQGLGNGLSHRLVLKDEPLSEFLPGDGLIFEIDYFSPNDIGEIDQFPPEQEHEPGAWDLPPLIRSQSRIQTL